MQTYRGVDVAALGTALDSRLMQRLFDILARSELLESLTLRTVSSVDAEGVRLISRLVEHTRSLKKLSLRMQKLDFPRAIDALFEAIESNASIDIDYDALIRIGEMLHRNTTLKTLSLEAHEKLHDPCVQALIEAVKANISITKIESFLRGLYLGNSPFLRRELDYYLELNKGPRQLLCKNKPVPTGLWPLALDRADTFSRGSNCPPNVLYFLVREKCNLFAIGRRK
jgi:hypothetical protein